MVNPHMAHEHRTRHVPPAVCSRKVLVVGGGVAGMEAAITAADRGHKVVLVEKAEELGGVIRFADYDSIKVQLKKYRKYLVRQVMKRNIDVRLSTEATEGLIEALQPDAILVATGAKPIIHIFLELTVRMLCMRQMHITILKNSVKKSLLLAVGL